MCESCGLLPPSKLVWIRTDQSSVDEPYFLMICAACAAVDEEESDESRLSSH